MSTARSGAAVVRQTRLWLGLVLFTYLTTHFLNHALGLISLDALAGARRQPPVTARAASRCVLARSASAISPGVPGV